MVVKLNYRLLEIGLLGILKRDINKNKMSSSVVKIVYRYRSDLNDNFDKKEFNHTYDEREKYNRSKDITVDLDKNLSHDDIINIAVEKLKLQLGYKVEIIESKISLTLF